MSDVSIICNSSDPAPCGGEGRCAFDPTRNLTVCDCNDLWLASSGCTINYYQVWGDAELFEPVFDLACGLAVLIWLILELGVDFRRFRRASWRRIGVLAKMLLGLVILFQIARAGMVFYQVAYRTVAIDSAVDLMEEVGVTVGSILFWGSMLYWIEIVQKAKQLDLSVTSNRVMRAARIMIIIWIVIFIATSFPLLVLLRTNYDHPSVAADYTTAEEAIWAVSTAIGWVFALVFVIPHTVWARKMLRTSKSESLKRVVERNAVLLCVVLITMCGLILNVVQDLYPDTPWNHYSFAMVFLVFKNIPNFGYCLFLESYARVNRRPVSYARGWCGDVDNMTTVGTARPKTATTPSSGDEPADARGQQSALSATGASTASTLPEESGPASTTSAS